MTGVILVKEKFGVGITFIDLPKNTVIYFSRCTKIMFERGLFYLFTLHPCSVME